MQTSIVPTNSNLTKELERVAAALDKAGQSSAKRIPLLRRQAALGDLRDALALRARRSND